MPGAPSEPVAEQDAPASARASDAPVVSAPEPDHLTVAASETAADDDQSPVVSPPQPGDTAVVEPLIDRRPPRPAPLVTPGMHETTICHVCGNRLEPDDIFCGECGAVRPAVTAAFTGPVMPLPMTRPDWAADDTAGTEPSEASTATNQDDGHDSSADEPADPDGSADFAALDEPDDEIQADDESVPADVEQSSPGGRPAGRTLHRRPNRRHRAGRLSSWIRRSHPCRVPSPRRPRRRPPRPRAHRSLRPCPRSRA
ncbi:hypothetical protein Q9Q99_04250 [Curtobacterium flaccumfaciens]|nr:hypothetical protein Q9Q99_04250 [Curtobacterium flaccumfaciens]